MDKFKPNKAKSDIFNKEKSTFFEGNLTTFPT